MRICFVNNMMNSGGIARTITTIANILCEDNEVFLLNTYDRACSFYEINGKIGFFSLCENEKKSFLRRIKLLKRFFNSKKPDVVLTFHFNDSFLVSCSLVNNSKIKHIACERNDPHKVPYTTIKRAIRNIGFNMANAWCFQTNGAAKYFVKKKNNKKYCVIPNPVNLITDKQSHSNELNKVIFTVGRLEKQKNQSLLIKAFSRIRHLIPDYILKIYGVGSLRERLESETKELLVHDYVKFMGESKSWQLDEFDSTLFVLSSDYEGMPNVLEEALFLGIPCLSTDCSPGGARELISNGENGTIVAPNNIEEMSKAILNIVNNIDFYRKLAYSNYLKRDKYSVTAIANRWISFIFEVVNEQK